MRKFLTHPWLANRYTAFAAFMLALTTGAELMGALSSLVYHWAMEGVLLAYLYALLNLCLRPNRWAPWIAGLPIAVAYILHDGYFMTFGSVFRVADFHEIPELMLVLTPLQQGALFLALLGPTLLVLACIAPRRWGWFVLGLIPGMAIVGATQWAPELVVTVFDEIGEEIVWSDAYTVMNNGRFATLILHEAERQAALRQSVRYLDPAGYERQAAQEAAALKEHLKLENNQPRHVHLVVLESFVDPTLMQAVKFTPSPRHPDFAKFFGTQLGLSISPVFGGGTAQAEFETLCGVPAFEALSSIEFNIFTGAPAHCMPDILARAGYRSVATNAYKPNFFNAIKAYRGIGFADAFFAAEYGGQRATYLSAADVSLKEEYLFDASLFQQNLSFVRQSRAQQPEVPMLNYVLSIYGHFPHDMDLERRPKVISVVMKHKDEQLELAANQHYYRTQAMAAFIKGLVETDPHSLIVMVSDHLPPLDDGTTSYDRVRYLDNMPESTFTNRIIIVQDGKPVKYRTIHHYDIPSLVYNYLSDGWYCRTHTCNLKREERKKEAYREDYMRLISHAANPDF